ncbi:MAG TPA: hypothetical protein VK071_04745 [Tissierellales bacterium]|nr:hypothetical protein [Tissierellales bacterium]
MRIGEILKHNDIDTYRRLKKLPEKAGKRSSAIKLGDSVENLMKANSYRRIGRRVRQVKRG